MSNTDAVVEGFVLPKIEQIAYVVPDLHAAIKRFGNVFGIGPFIVREHVQFNELKFHGKDSPVDYSLAQAWHGDVQIEFLQQHNDAPSILNRYPTAPNAVHHLGMRTRDYGTDEKRLLDAGFRKVQHIALPNGTLVSFYYGGEVLGLVELIYPADGGLAWEQFKERSRSWDRQSLYAD